MRVAPEHIDDVPADEQEPMPQTARLGGTDVFRGALVVLTALVIGGFVISRGLDDGPAEDTATEETAAAEGTALAEPADIDDPALADSSAPTVPATPTTGAEVTTPPAATDQVTDPATGATETVAPEGPAVRSPAEVKVLVLNGAQTQGIAGRGTEVLKAASYLTGDPKNATTQRPSGILFVEGYQAEALAVAAAFGPGLETLVQPLDPADVPIDDTQDSHVIVVIGADELIPIS